MPVVIVTCSSSVKNQPRNLSGTNYNFLLYRRNYRVVVREGHSNSKFEFKSQDHKILAVDFGKSFNILELQFTLL